MDHTRYRLGLCLRGVLAHGDADAIPDRKNRLDNTCSLTKQQPHGQRAERERQPHGQRAERERQPHGPPVGITIGNSAPLG